MVEETKDCRIASQLVRYALPASPVKVRSSSRAALTTDLRHSRRWRSAINLVYYRSPFKRIRFNDRPLRNFKRLRDFFTTLIGLALPTYKLILPLLRLKHRNRHRHISQIDASRRIISQRMLQEIAVIPLRKIFPRMSAPTFLPLQSRS